MMGDRKKKEGQSEIGMLAWDKDYSPFKDRPNQDRSIKTAINNVQQRDMSPNDEGRDIRTKHTKGSDMANLL